MRESGHIKLSNSLWTTPTVLVPKKEGLAILRQPAAERCDSYPLPHINEFLDLVPAKQLLAGGAHPRDPAQDTLLHWLGVWQFKVHALQSV
ncbi:UNVERIFIED_CONTAM: hypothetical protein FKN15_047329 [Acipenser sinensis]